MFSSTHSSVVKSWTWPLSDLGSPVGFPVWTNNLELSDSLQEESVTGVQSRPCALCEHSQLHRLACSFLIMWELCTLYITWTPFFDVKTDKTYLFRPEIKKAGSCLFVWNQMLLVESYRSGYCVACERNAFKTKKTWIMGHCPILAWQPPLKRHFGT